MIEIKSLGRMACLSAALLMLTLAASNRISAQDPAKAPDAPQAKFVGQAACAACHTDKVEAFGKTFHGRKALSQSKLANACESCHGAGGDHIDGGGDVTKIKNPAKMTASQVSETCFSCHKDKSLMMWKTGAHANNEVSCLKCHSIHEGEGRQSLLKGKTETCYQCHKKQKADMRLASHHPVPEGKLSCVSCHNPHGGMEGNLKADSEIELCAKCHTEKVGPFANEHPPVTDSCSNCHVVHGSSNERLMKKPVQMLCMSCHRKAHGSHGSTSAAATVAKQARCIDCHHDIHGSDQVPFMSQ